MGNRNSDITAPSNATPHTNAASSTNTTPHNETNLPVRAATVARSTPSPDTTSSTESFHSAETIAQSDVPPIIRATPPSTSIERPRGKYDHLGYRNMDDEARTRYDDDEMPYAEQILRLRVDLIIQELGDSRWDDGLAIRGAFLKQTAERGLLPTLDWLEESQEQLVDGTWTGASLIPRVKPVPHLPAPRPQPPPTEPSAVPTRPPPSPHGGSQATLVEEGGPENAEANEGAPAEEKSGKQAKKSEKRRRQRRTKRDREQEKQSTARAPEETIPLSRSQVLLQRTPSVTTIDRIRPPSQHVDYSKVPLACDRRGSTSKSSIVAQESKGVTLATVHSDDGEPSGREFDRRNYKAIRGISRAVLEELGLDLVDPEKQLSPGSCRVTQRKEGSFHHAVFLKIERDDEIPQEYVLKILAQGTPKEWGMNDRAPYILVKKMEGMAATDLWLGQPYRMVKTDDLHLEADDPSPEVEQKRVTFLRSFAQAMSQPVTLEFQYTGVPNYEYPEDKNPKFIAPAWRWHCKMNMEEATSYGSFATDEESFAAGLDRLCEPEKSLDSDGMTDVGVQMVMRIILSSAPFKLSTPSQAQISQAG
ncbi:hypothetical protein BKA58DRAFT_444816 [Alternaria rosae]|uniref:uncharacterized protein n=1 Tax=Alternaria rosae TaxID=1187941 RepID=UPI001E8EB5A3|nr:uncharacterized protein BKA58DRAFT_444816 [Alternaria rosae]KAH6853015.1 hypothetical protein BKA58DRAFT_444816 [Alternaria rosae]